MITILCAKVLIFQGTTPIFNMGSLSNLSNPVEIRNVGIKALQEALGPVGMVKFMQQYDMGYGDYTKEKQEQPDISLEEIDMLLKK